MPILEKNENETTATQPVKAKQILLIMGIVLIAANLRPAITSVGPLIDFIRADLRLSNSMAGLITTIPLIGFALISFLIPKMGHRFGNRLALFAGVIILLCGILIRSMSLTVALFFGAALVGLGIAICNVLLPGLVRQEFPKKIGLMTSVYSTCLVVFASFASGLSVPLAQGLGLGWQKALGLWAILAVIAVLVWIPQLGSQNKDSHDSQSVQSSQIRLWYSPLAWQVTLFMGLQSFAFYVTITWLPEILHDKGMSISMAGWMLSFMIFIGLPATFFAPILADRLPDQKAIAIAIGIFYFLGYGGLLVGGGIILMTFWIVCIGIALGASVSLALSYLGLRAANSRQAAELSGMAQSIGYLLAALGPILIGALFDFTHSWTLPLYTLLVAGVIMTIVGIGAGRDKYV